MEFLIIQFFPASYYFPLLSSNIVHDTPFPNAVNLEYFMSSTNYEASPLCYFAKNPLTSYLLGPSILLSTVITNTLTLFSSPQYEGASLPAGYCYINCAILIHKAS
jgi:hypothetical protein